MNDKHNAIDKYFVDILTIYEGKRSARFRMKFHLMLMLFKFKFLVLLILIGLCIAFVGYLGYSFVYLPDLVLDTQKQQSEEIIDKSSDFLEKSSVFHPVLKSVVEPNQPKLNKQRTVSNALSESTRITAVGSQFPEILRDETIVLDRVKNLNKLEFRYMTSFHVDQKSPMVFDSILNPIISEKTSVVKKQQDPIALNCTTSIIQKKQLSFSYYVSPDVTWQRLNADRIYEEFVQLRKEQEAATSSWSTGADIQIHWKSWYAQVGLNYSRYQTKTNYDFNYEQLDSANSYFKYDTSWVWVYNPPNLGYPLMTGIDTVWVPVFKDIHVAYDGKTQWSYLEIPVLIGFKFGKTKVGFEVATGISIGFLMEVKGRMPRFPQMDGTVTLSDQSEILNKTVWNGILQFGISYQFTPKWSALAQPYYKHNVRSVFDKNYSVNQKFSAVGVKFGFRYCF